jgi:hypothetical protein
MIELIGDQNAPVCEDGVCAVPQPEDTERRSDDSADPHSRRLVEVQRLGDPLQRRVGT